MRYLQLCIYSMYCVSEGASSLVTDADCYVNIRQLLAFIFSRYVDVIKLLDFNFNRDVNIRKLLILFSIYFRFSYGGYKSKHDTNFIA
jgi:hypothetical protein